MGSCPDALTACQGCRQASDASRIFTALIESALADSPHFKHTNFAWVVRWCNLAIPAFAFFQVSEDFLVRAIRRCNFAKLRQELLERLALLSVCAVREGLQAKHSPIQSDTVVYLAGSGRSHADLSS